MKIILCFILSALLAYLIGVFFMAQFNIALWYEGCRYSCILMFLFFTVISVLIVKIQE